jgi:hypothetical protein
MSDLATETDGSLHEAAEALNRRFASHSEVPADTDDDGEDTSETKPERPRGPDGKFLPTKPKDDTIPLTPADGSEDPDEVEQEQAEEPDAEEEQEEEAPPKKPIQPIKLNIGGKVQEFDAAVVTVPVKVDGMVKQVPLSEALGGYSRTEDYTRKTQAVAEEKKRFEAEVVAPLTEERRYYAERIGLIEEALQEFQQERAPDWNMLRGQLDPEAFQQRWVEWDTRQKHLAGIQAEKAKVAERAAAAEQQALQARLAEEHEKLQVAIPEFADPEKGPALKADLVAYAKSKGFSDDDLAQVTDHRVLVLLNNSRKWEESQLRRPKLEDKVDRVLESVKPSSTKPKPKLSEIERAQADLAKTGRVEDAARAINLKFQRR